MLYCISALQIDETEKKGVIKPTELGKVALLMALIYRKSRANNEKRPIPDGIGP